MPTPFYIIGEHDGELIVADEQFTQFWRRDEAIRPPVRSPAEVIEVALNATRPFFQYTDHSELGRHDMVLVGIPGAHGSLQENTAVAAFPEQLRMASQRYPAYASIDEPGSSGLYDVDEQRSLFKSLIWRDLGNLLPEATAEPATLEQQIARLTGWAVKNNIKTVTIGGDHSVTYPLARTFAASAARPLILVDFDAHNDCGISVYPEERIHHANFVRHLLDLEHVIGIIQVGVRGIRSPGQVFSHHKLIQLPPSDRNERDLLAAIDRLRASAPEAAGYVSIDLDVLDPRDFPWVDFPMAGGLSTRTLLALVRAVFCSPLSVLGVDIMEGCGDRQVEHNDYDVPLRILAHVMDGILLQCRR